MAGSEREFLATIEEIRTDLRKGFDQIDQRFQLLEQKFAVIENLMSASVRKLSNAADHARDF